MIQLTRLNNSRLAVNSDLIKYVEQSPDTVITLLSGEKLLVRETTEQVIERVRDFRRSILTGTVTFWLQQSGFSAESGSGVVNAGAQEPDCG